MVSVDFVQGYSELWKAPIGCEISFNEWGMAFGQGTRQFDPRGHKKGEMWTYEA